MEQDDLTYTGLEVDDAAAEARQDERTELIEFFEKHDLAVIDTGGDDFTIDHVLGMMHGERELPEWWENLER